MTVQALKQDKPARRNRRSSKPVNVPVDQHQAEQVGDLAIVQPGELLKTFSEQRGERDANLTRVQLCERLADRRQPVNGILKEAIAQAETNGGETAKKTMQTYASTIKAVVGAMRYTGLSVIANEGFVALGKRSKVSLKKAGITWEGYNTEARDAEREAKADNKALSEALNDPKLQALPVAERALKAAENVQKAKSEAQLKLRIEALCKLIHGLSVDEGYVLDNLLAGNAAVQVAQAYQEYLDAKDAHKVKTLDDDGLKAVHNKMFDLYTVLEEIETPDENEGDPSEQV